MLRAKDLGVCYQNTNRVHPLCSPPLYSLSRVVVLCWKPIIFSFIEFIFSLTPICWLGVVRNKDESQDHREKGKQFTGKWPPLPGALPTVGLLSQHKIVNFLLSPYWQQTELQKYLDNCPIWLKLAELMSEKGLDCGCHSISIVSPLCSQSRTWVLRSKQGSLISTLTNPAAQHPENFVGSGSMAVPVWKTCCQCCFPLSFSSFLLSSTWASEAELAPCLCKYLPTQCMFSTLEASAHILG